MEQIKRALFYSSGKNLNVGPWKRMWMEIPHVPFFAMHVILAGSYAIYKIKYDLQEGVGLQSTYTVMRSDDPRVERIKKKMEP